MNIYGRCLHGQWVGSIGECVAGDAYNEQPPPPQGTGKYEDPPPEQQAGGSFDLGYLAAAVAVGSPCALAFLCAKLCQQRQDKALLTTAAQINATAVQGQLLAGYDPRYSTADPGVVR